ncbi:MAG TPA: hypothetical protein VMU55_05740 [Solirubrobacteraceae bacterium]|nr:hypothetical protein [Solirubrobacteraceae bacterium]
MTEQKRKPREDDGLSVENYQPLNEEFYAGDPADYFIRRLQGLLILKGKPDALRELMLEGVDAGGVRLQLTAGDGPGAESAKDDAEGRDRFVTADAWLLLHHASETLLRLYLAHTQGAPCPALEIARDRRAGAFKKQIRHRFIVSRRSPEHHAENGEAFYGSPTAEGLSDADDDSRQALLDNVEGLLRLFASTFLDAEAYNAIKHSMAIRTGNSRLNIKVGDRDLGTTEGPHIEYIGIRETPERFVWAHKTIWLDFDLIVARVYTAQRMILALWLVARHRYLGVQLDAIPSLRHPTADELSRSDAITWTSFAKDLIYTTPDLNAPPTADQDGA